MTASDHPSLSGRRIRLAHREILGLLLSDAFTVIAAVSALGFFAGLWTTLASIHLASSWFIASVGVLLAVPVIWLVLFDYTRLRVTHVAVARGVPGGAWQVLIGQDTARSLRGLSSTAWRRVPGWKSGFLTFDADEFVLWKLRGWGAEPVLAISSDDVLGIRPCQESLSDWHRAELPAVELELTCAPGRLVLFPSDIRASEMARFQREVVSWVEAWKGSRSREGC